MERYFNEIVINYGQHISDGNGETAIYNQKNKKHKELIRFFESFFKSEKEIKSFIKKINKNRKIIYVNKYMILPEYIKFYNLKDYKIEERKSWFFLKNQASFITVRDDSELGGSRLFITYQKEAKKEFLILLKLRPISKGLNHICKYMVQKLGKIIPRII